MAQWTSKYKGNLPKSSYAWVDSSGVGHLPYKDAKGNIDLPHVRNALARLNQVKGMPAAAKASVRKKLEAILNSKSAEEYSYFKDAIELTETKDIQIFPMGHWEHPKWGSVDMTPERAENFVNNYDNNVYGQDVPIDFAHGKDVSKGDRAAGWITGLSAKEDGLYATVDLTQTAADEIRAGEWRYFSPTFWDNWESPTSGETVSDLLIGGALTNRPFLKGIAPLNFEEIEFDVPEWMHVNPPDPVNPPAKPEDFDAWPNQEKGVPIFENYQPPGTSNVKNNLSEGGDMPDSELEKKIRELLKLDEKADLEATLKTLSDDAAQARTLRETVNKQKTFEEQFPEQARLLEEARTYRTEQQAKTFAESYMRPTSIINSEGVEVAPKGALPMTAIDKLREMAQTFTEDDFKTFGAVIDDIVQVGLVPIGEVGSTGGSNVSKTSGNRPEGTLAEQIAAGVRKVMSEDDKLDYETAVRKYAEENPELYKEYTDHGIPQSAGSGK